MGNNCCTPAHAANSTLEEPQKKKGKGRGRGITTNKNIKIEKTAGEDIVEESRNQTSEQPLYISSSENFKTQSVDA